MTPGERVVHVAGKYLAVHENPWGSNLGRPQPEGWQSAFGMRGVPWCACAVAGWYSEAGVDMQGIGSPSTQAMADRAKAVGAVVARPAPGVIGVYPGVHTFIVSHVVSANATRTAGLIATIEGNHGDAVGTAVRSYGPGTGLMLIAPKELREQPAAVSSPERLYYIENLEAKPVLFGPWRSKAARDRRLAKLPAARRKAARPFHNARGYGWLEGPRKLYGPWHTAAARNAALISLAKRLPHQPLRAMSKPAPVNVRADGMGKTT